MLAENAAAPNRRTIVITVLFGLIGSVVATCFHEQSFVVHPFDSNRRHLLWVEGHTRWNKRRLETALTRFHHQEIDI
jgi:hypothetical protein